jgi:hypothetical protein
VFCGYNILTFSGVYHTHSTCCDENVIVVYWGTLIRPCWTQTLFVELAWPDYQLTTSQYCLRPWSAQWLNQLNTFHDSNIHAKVHIIVFLLTAYNDVELLFSLLENRYKIMHFIYFVFYLHLTSRHPTRLQFVATVEKLNIYKCIGFYLLKINVFLFQIKLSSTKKWIVVFRAEII